MEKRKLTINKKGGCSQNWTKTEKNAPEQAKRSKRSNVSLQTNRSDAYRAWNYGKSGWNYFQNGSFQEDEFETASIPLGGDQLTRVFFDSAKNLRAGTHTPTERLEQISPVVEEFFHMEQDLLEKMVKKFFKSENSREGGTLAHFKALLR
ncbi:uncharacterized protein LOC144356546 [Saccoglossus kowalevskii]